MCAPPERSYVINSSVCVCECVCMRERKVPGSMPGYA